MSQSLGWFDFPAAYKQRAVQSIFLLIPAWISNTLILWGSSRPCPYQARACGCCRGWLSILQW